MDYNIVTRTRRELEIEAWRRCRAWYMPKSDEFVLDAGLRVEEFDAQARCPACGRPVERTRYANFCECGYGLD